MSEENENLDLFEEVEEVVSRDGKKVKRKGIFLLPNLLTTTSLFFGFFSIISSIQADFVSAGMAIFAAAIFDGLDGRVARLAKAESIFGEQYDSICDVISFGLAPAIAVFLWGLEDLGRAGWIFAFLYVAAAALRLARFNANIGSESTFFRGLPSPAAAGTIGFFVWAMASSGVQENLVSDMLSVLTALLTGVVAILMVANIPYYSFKEIDKKRRVPFIVLLGVVFFLGLLALDPPIVLVICSSIYTLSGPIIWAVKRLRN